MSDRSLRIHKSGGILNPGISLTSTLISRSSAAPGWRNTDATAPSPARCTAITLQDWTFIQIVWRKTRFRKAEEAYYEEKSQWAAAQREKFIYQSGAAAHCEVSSYFWLVPGADRRIFLISGVIFPVWDRWFSGPLRKSGICEMAA